MKLVAVVSVFALLGVLTFAGGVPQQGGDMVERDLRSVQGINRAIQRYIDSREQATILTSGEFSAWSLKLEVGQVVIAEARSDVFDPALSIVDASGHMMADNDDRYPGDQRPLLLWRCTEKGTYSLRLSSYHDKTGGQGFVRYRIYDCMDIGSDKPVDKVFDTNAQFLLRIPMKAGQIKQVNFDTPNGNFAPPILIQTVSPVGLPDCELAGPLDKVIPRRVMATVDGDYYVVAQIYPPGRPITVRAHTEDIPATPLTRDGGRCAVKATTNKPSLWVITVKQGEFLEISTPQLSGDARFVVAEQPDISKFDLSKPETNPFYPLLPGTPEVPPAITGLPKRANDYRLYDFVVLRDTKLWVATNGTGPKNIQYTLNVQPAAADYTPGYDLKGDLRVGNTDYWSFDTKAGDVMAFKATAKPFAATVVVRGPDLGETSHAEAGLDQTQFNWEMIVQRPGRYLTCISCKGDGGSGAYELSRQVFHPKEFAKGFPAKGEISTGQTQVWKFTAKPGEPLYVKWWSSRRSYDISVRNENGDDSDIPLTDVGDTSYGIINVSQPTTYVLVLTSNGEKAQYSIELSDLPGYVKKK
jgi:hypothetical protein